MSNITAVSNSAPAKARLTTPQLLKAGLYMTWGASLAVALATLAGVQGQRNAIKTVGKDSVPSIITAQRIKDALGGMDADAANELIAKPGQNQDAVKGYEERRQKLAERLVAAAENITEGDAERKPIQTLQLALGDYISKIQQARDFHAMGDTNKVLAVYRSAAKIMDEKLLPAADALDAVNLKSLDRAYESEQFASGFSLFFVVVSGFLLIGVLVAIQLFLNYRMRRILNPMLLAATAIAIVFLGYTTQALLSASHHLKVATKDAFASMHALRQTRALAYSANGDESRYLLDSALAIKHQQTFFNKTAKLATIPANQTFQTVATAEAQGKQVNGFTGYLADELNNITFPGEKEAAVANLTTFGTYLDIDKQIRQLQQRGKHQEAIALCIGDNPGQSNWAFKQFLQANNKVYDINDKAFNTAVEAGFQDLNNFEIATPVVAVSIALLTLFGLQPRLKEYFF